MATMTDPARELSEIAQRLTQSSNAKGVDFLAGQFGVEAWSTEFFRIVTCILERADLVADTISRSTMDEDHQRSAAEDLEGFKSAFTRGALINNWNNAGSGLTLVQQHGRPLQYLSPTVRQVICYPRLSDDEIVELVAHIDRYSAELRASEEELPLVRQGILDGLALFRFQLTHIGWLGAGYTLAAFRELMLVFDWANRQQPDSDDLNPRAALSGLLSILKAFKGHVDAAKGWRDTGETIWKAYRLTSSVALPFLLPGTGS